MLMPLIFKFVFFYFLILGYMVGYRTISTKNLFYKNETISMEIALQNGKVLTLWQWLP